MSRNGTSAEAAFGAQVRQARERRGWTQEQLATYLRASSEIDLSPTAMNRLELGKRPIRLNEVAALANLLDIEPGAYGNSQDQLSQRQYEQAREELNRLQEEDGELRYRLEAAAREMANAQARYAEISDRVRFMHHRISIIETTIMKYETARSALREALENGLDGKH